MSKQDALKWFKELPQEEGDYLWMAMWGCNCCIQKKGIVTIKDVTDADADFLVGLENRFRYTSNDGKTLIMLGADGDMPDLEDGKYPEVDGWLEITSFPKSMPAKGGIVTYKPSS